VDRRALDVAPEEEGANAAALVMERRAVAMDSFIVISGICVMCVF